MTSAPAAKPLLPTVNLGRDRNKIKSDKWSFYIKAEGPELAATLKTLRTTAASHKARVPGGSVPLEFERVARNKVQIAWPKPVCADGCSKVLRHALGERWRDWVTDPALVQGATMTAATPREEPPPSSAGPASSGAPVTVAATAARPWQIEAARVATFRKPNLLPMKLEAMTALLLAKDQRHFEDLPQEYTVKWEAVLGEGSYGKVYVGRKRSATDRAPFEEDTCYAIKLLWDTSTGWAADQEVRRHAALGLHPNLVGLIDVGLFRDDSSAPSCNSHIGLVCDLYEIDVRQFLKTSRFTQGGMRHVLNCVLHGLQFLHDRGCVHCDLKPANIFMRGAIHLRGCFLPDGSLLQQHTGFPRRSSMEFLYQIPNSFEV